MPTPSLMAATRGGGNHRLACGLCPEPLPPGASNAPPAAPGLTAVWYTVDFATNSFTINADGQKVINNVINALQHDPVSVATLIGRTDTVGTADYNMRLSHRRADAVPDAVVYGGKLTADRVETRWTGERRLGVPTGDADAVAQNRVVDIAIH